MPPWTDMKTASVFSLLADMLSVPYDQWLITHLDTSWTIKQAKDWILSRCNLSHGADVPRPRPASPITFATTNYRSRGSGSTASNNEEDDGDEEEEGIGSGEGSLYIEDGDNMSETASAFDIRLPPRSRSFTDYWQSNPQRRSESTASGMSSASGTLQSHSTNYILISFSNAHILEDTMELSSYKLRPYEMLELHPARHPICLHREDLSEYVRPYFEARVRALRNTNKENKSSDGFLGTMVNIGSSGKRTGLGLKIGKQKIALHHSEPGSARDYVRHLGRDEAQSINQSENRDGKKHPEKQKKFKVQWKDRWLVVHEGHISLRDRESIDTTNPIPLNCIVHIRGAEQVHKSGPPPQSNRVICIKYLTRAASPPASVQSTPASARHKDPRPASTPSTRQPSPAPRMRESYHYHRPLPVDQQPRSPLTQHQGMQLSASPPSSFNDCNLSPTRASANSSLSGSLRSRHASNSSSEWTQERDFGMGMNMGMATGMWGMSGAGGTSQSCSTGTSTSASTSRSASVSAGTGDADIEVEEGWEKIDKSKAKEVSGDWLVLEMLDDGALLRILHRHASSPVSSTFLPKTNTIPSNPSVHSISTSSISSKPSVHFPGTPRSPIAFTSPFSSGSPPSSTTDSAWSRPIPLTSGTSGGDYLFGIGYLAPTGAQQYPEWRTRLAYRARKAGVGEISKAKEWIMWGKDVVDSAEGSAREDTETEESTTMRRKRRDTLVTLASIASDGTIGLTDPPPPLLTRPTSVHGREGESESEDETLSDVEWEGWMRDLDRQSSVREEARRRQHKHPMNRTLSSYSSSESLPHRPRALTLTTLTPVSPTASSSNLRSPEMSLMPGHEQHPLGSPVASPTRRRSSTVTAASVGSRLLRKKEKGKEKERDPPPPLPNLPSNFVRATPEKPKLTVALTDPGHSSRPLSAGPQGTSDSIAELPPSEHPVRTAILRHVRSASNMHRSLRGEKERNNIKDQEGPSISTSDTGEATETSTTPSAPTKKRSGLHERLVRGLDSALDFVTT
ncbi:hypothetical protein HWV62_40786 [Athelia sp. TMB]|nr:hypothetical protein HWV62_40786 [Athelia sp. TMB]